MTTYLIDGQHYDAADVRFTYDDWNGTVLVVCDDHQQWAVNRMASYSAGALAPVDGVPTPCVACTAGDAVEEYPIDARGRAYCGQDFMAGTICTLPPDHDGPHAPICQECGGDWYSGTCTCTDDEEE